MKLNLKVLTILVIGIALSITSPKIIISLTNKKVKDKQEIITPNTQTVNNEVTIQKKRDTAVPVTPKEEIKEEVKEEPAEEEQTKEKAVQKQEVNENPVVEIAQTDPAKPYQDMTTEELINAIASGTFRLEYTASYNTNANKLTKSKGAIYYENHKETYYSQRVLPGTSLNIPGRHVADDGTVRDGDGYICVAANSSYLSKGTIVKTSLGPAKVYDSGCASGIIDIYTNW